jgi:heme b synthase
LEEISRKNPEGRELAPRVVVWESTRACSFACLHCRAQAQKAPDPKQLSTEEALRLVEQIAEFGEPIFIISGGDPLERTDIFEVAKYATNMRIRVVMSPSGSSLTPKVIEKMKASGVKMISVSLDGSNAEIHDGFRQVQGAFGTSLSNIGYAREAQLPFQVNTTVTKHNLQDLPRIMNRVLELGAAAWDVFMLVPTGRGKLTMEITPKQYEETMNFVYESSLKSPIPIKMTCSPHYSRVAIQRNSSLCGSSAQNRSGSHGGTRGCMAGNGFCFVSHIGEVFGCGFLPIRAGSIREKRLKEIYQESPLFLELRNPLSLRGKCGGCEYKLVCGGCRARAFSVKGDYLQGEPYCEYMPKVDL